MVWRTSTDCPVRNWLSSIECPFFQAEVVLRSTSTVQTFPVASFSFKTGRAA